MKMKKSGLTGITVLIIITQQLIFDHELFASGRGAMFSYERAGNASTIKVDVLPPSCQGRNDAVADLSITGTDAPYQILWSNASSDEDQGGLAPGDYQVTVTGNSGEALQLSVTVPAADPLTAEMVSANVTCHSGNNGSVEFDISGGQAPYVIEYYGGSVSQSRITDLLAGTYEFTISDANGCMIEKYAVIDEPEPVAEFRTSDVSCHGASDGKVELINVAASENIRFIWSDGSSGTTFSGLSGGIHTLDIICNDGCKSQYAFAVFEPEALKAEITATDASCEKGGTLSVAVSGGEAPFDYLWSDGSEVANLDRLEPGNYQLVVTDKNNCRVKSAATVAGVSSRMTLLLTAVSASCADISDGSIDLHVSGGKGPLSYLWSNGNTAEDQLLVPAGEYTVTVTDASGCSQSSSVVLESASSMMASISVFNTGCAGTDQGLTVVVSGGAAPYQYKWSDGTRNSSVHEATEGVYSVLITDANGCSAELKKEISIAEPMVLTESIALPSGRNKSDGKIQTQIKGGVGPYIFEWSDGSSGNDATGLSPGFYSLTVTDSRGCSVEHSFDLRIGGEEELLPVATKITVSSVRDIRVANSGANAGIPVMMISGAPGESCSLVLLDITGRIVSNLGTFSIADGGMLQVEVPSAELQSGVYLVRVSFSDITRSVKLNIVN